jgi:hypothetical protein
MQALLGSLTEAERLLVRETEREQLAGLTEDELVDLHTRIRRARDKYVKLYRRESAARVTTVGGRGKAFEKGTRDRGKAEVFEEALARVSTRLAAAARESARMLRAERVEEARTARNTAPPRTAAPRRATAPRKASQRIDRSVRTPDRAKRHGSTRAMGARRQARKDSRTG